MLRLPLAFVSVLVSAADVVQDIPMPPIASADALPNPTREPLLCNGNVHGTDSEYVEQSRHAGSGAGVTIAGGALCDPDGVLSAATRLGLAYHEYFEDYVYYVYYTYSACYDSSTEPAF